MYLFLCYNGAKGDNMYKIMIVEDDVKLRSELKILLEHSGYEGIVLESFKNTKQDIIDKKPDLVLLDINIPNISGEYILKELRKESSIPIIMVTSKNNETDEIISMSFGADDYITKPYHPQLLLLRIEAVLKRFTNNNNLLSYRHIKLNISKSIIEANHQEYPLSKNEMRIFYYLLTHVGKIVSREEIMDYLWNTETFIDDNTLTVNITRLRTRLDEIGLTDVIETKRGLGYILV